jgi:predicted HTH transcriptional regulator
MALKDTLESLLRERREGRGVEFKRAANWATTAVQAKVVRAALAMANKQDGGIIAFGLESRPGQPLHELAGMSRADYDSFTQDAVSSVVNTYASPHIDLTVEHLTFDEKEFVVVVVREFADYPVVCVKDFIVNDRPVIIRGKLYCRSRRMPESTEVQSPDDMRDIIELATTKGLERYFRHREIERGAVTPDSDDLFKRQLGDLSL